MAEKDALELRNDNVCFGGEGQIEVWSAVGIQWELNQDPGPIWGFIMNKKESNYPIMPIKSVQISDAFSQAIPDHELEERKKNISLMSENVPNFKTCPNWRRYFFWMNFFFLNVCVCFVLSFKKRKYQEKGKNVYFHV